MPSRPEPAATPIQELAQSPPVKEGFRLLEEGAEWLTDRQMEFTRIPAPSFGERARAQYFLRQFAELGLCRTHCDEVGNVVAEWPGTGPARHRRSVALTAHLDTVFPPGARIDVFRQNGRLYGPGVTDNGAGLAALLGLARLFCVSRLRCRDTILFVANVAEEGEGNLFGMRYLLDQEEIREQVRCMLVLDGADVEHITAHGLGSRRFQVTISGPGGHSWTDFGMAHPIYALAAAITELCTAAVPGAPRTTFNVGEVQGGTSINSIPSSASFKLDIRSASTQEICRISALLEAAVRQALEAENRRARCGLVTGEIKEIGERPAADLPEGARILQVVQDIDQLLGIRSRVERSSTDANVPLSLGIEALSLGGGGAGGGAHSLQEWYDPSDRVLGLRRLWLATCALAGIEL
jgi:acetylornithine deacetylase/succinyl-diaminopimelate desuccinylase-like protein